MSNKITFKECLADFFKGIWQALCRVGYAFNPKDKIPFWRAVWTIITICVVKVTGILAAGPCFGEISPVAALVTSKGETVKH